MPSRLALPRSRKRGGRGRAGTKRRRLSRIERVEKAVYLLHRRIAKLEGRKKRIGFQRTDVEGDGIEQDDLEYDYTPDEVP